MKIGEVNVRIMGMLKLLYPVSVIIPVHRADLNIEKCINSLLLNDVLDLQIIVAANNDSPEELEKIGNKIRAGYTGCSNVSLLSIYRSGKATAINCALKYVKNEIVIITDADTYYCSKGLLECLSVMIRDDSVVAVSGNVDVYRENFLSCVQRFEYRRIFRVFRPFWNRFNCNMMISGCAGIFRTRCLVEVGLYDMDTVGEDFEITLRLHDFYIRNNSKYRIAYVNTAFARTYAPLSLKTLFRQRGRWFCGLVEITAKYRRFLVYPLRYKCILIPFVLAIVIEELSCFLKWLLISISVVICTVGGVFVLKGILYGLVFLVMLEVVFNCAMANRIIRSDSKFLRIIAILLLTVCLMGIQFVLKDTNVIWYVLRKITKKNKW